MKKNKVHKSVGLPTDEEILASHDFNDERTVAFYSTRKKHKKESIGWIIGGLLLFFFTLLSLGRITVVGQFFDDSIFNLVFGWFKFPVYLILLAFNICLYLGIHFKFKTRFLWMVGLTTTLICWTISLILMTIIYDQQIVIGGYTIKGLWSKDMLKNTTNIYWWNWLEHSIYAPDYAQTDKMELLFSPRGYVNLYAGGGILGTFLAGVSAYLSIPAAYLLLTLLIFLDLSWLFTGDPGFFFKPKARRRGHALRILSLKGRNNPNKKAKKNQLVNQDYQIWKSLNVYDPNIETEMRTSDLTIKMPSFGEAENELNLQEFVEDSSLKEKEDWTERKKTTFGFSAAPEKKSEAELLEEVLADSRELSPVEEPVFFQSRRVKNQKIGETNHFKGSEDLTDQIPQDGHYGSLDPNDARKLFEKDTNVRPFGRVNPTQEIKVDQDEALDKTSDTQFFEDLYEDEVSHASKSKKK